MVRAALIALSTVLVLGACEDAAPPVSPEQRDPAMVRALNDPLMTDPDLSSRNNGAAAITVATDSGLPVLPDRPEELAAARAEAAVLAGGQDRLGPIPAATGKVSPLSSPYSPAGHLALLTGETRCRATLGNSTVWAARLPEALPVYPRGATLAAAGGEGVGCRVAAVVFETPVPVSEVLAFYWQRAQAAGLAPIHRTAGDRSVVQGKRPGTAFDLRTAQIGGRTIVELATVTG